MGIITGYLGLVCMCLLLVKVLTRKLHLAKLNRYLMRIHKPVCAVLAVICVLHIILVFPVLKTRSLPVVVTGILAVGVLIFMIVLCHVIKEKKQNLRLHRILAFLMLCCVIGHIWMYFVDYQDYQNRIHKIEIENVVISDIKDGTYTGAYDAGYIYAKVEVEVRDGQIIKIDLLKHNNERGILAEKITEDVVTEQQIDVDAISGATNSSLVIKKAIENALSDD